MIATGCECGSKNTILKAIHNIFHVVFNGLLGVNAVVKIQF